MNKVEARVSIKIARVNNLTSMIPSRLLLATCTRIVTKHKLQLTPERPDHFKPVTF